MKLKKVSAYHVYLNQYIYEHPHFYEIWQNLLNLYIFLDKDDQDDADERSVFVKNVDYSAEPAELKDHFKECGEVKRVTIPVDKASQQPKGYSSIIKLT